MQPWLSPTHGVKAHRDGFGTVSSGFNSFSWVGLSCNRHFSSSYEDCDSPGIRGVSGGHGGLFHSSGETICL